MQESCSKYFERDSTANRLYHHTPAISSRLLLVNTLTYGTTGLPKPAMLAYSGWVGAIQTRPVPRKVCNTPSPLVMAPTIDCPLMQYAQDYDEQSVNHFYGPLGHEASNGTDPKYKWMDAIFPYVKSEQLFTCPSDSGTRRIYKRQIVGGPNIGDQNYGSYCMNNLDHTGGNAYTPPVGISLSQFATPATTIWVTDGQGSFENERDLSSNVSINTSVTPRTMGETVERHLDTTNVLYCDGHVKSQKLSALDTRTGANFLKHWSVEDD